MKKKRRIVMAITGASGSPYSKRLFDLLIESGAHVDLILSDTGKRIWADETGRPLSYFSEAGSPVHENSNLYADISSGSSKFEGMIIIPSSMGTLGKIAAGISDSLITRAANVALKEKRKLVLVPRESPYSSIDLENMLKLDRAGAVILPASPGFYHKPSRIEEIIDFIVARALEHLGFDQEIIPTWKPSDPT